MKSKPWLNTAIANSVQAVGEALGRLVTLPMPAAPAHRASGWADQFSTASHDQRTARCTVNALYRGATVRL